MADKAPAISIKVDHQKTTRIGEADLRERLNPELVIGFVGPIGSGVSTVVEYFRHQLESTYGYDTYNYRVSEFIKNGANRVGHDKEIRTSGPGRSRDLQILGNELRERLGSTYLISKVVEEIAVRRTSGGYKEPENDEPLVPLPLRRVHLIDSIKNPSEVTLLRQVYGDAFWLIAVFAPEDVRRARLAVTGSRGEELDEVLRHDEGDQEEDHGQKVGKTSHRADFFIRNDGTDEKSYADAVTRFLDLIFGTEISPPTQDEWAMAEAMTAASRSACLSRQVGAAIVSEQGELIGVGWNDVPKSGGSLYEVGTSDARCFRRLDGQDGHCRNDANKERIYDQIVSELGKLGVSGVDEKKLRKSMSQKDVKNLIEFSRAVHAEMEAIVSVARGGKNGLVGSTLYSTAFPCHSCARHIVAAGIKKVIYIEPYPKSLAIRLHGDSITTRERAERPTDGTPGLKVRFLQYEGVAPRNIERLFNSGRDRKDDSKGLIIKKERSGATPAIMPPLDGFYRREQMIVQGVKELESTSNETKGDNW